MNGKTVPYICGFLIVLLCSAVDALAFSAEGRFIGLAPAVGDTLKPSSDEEWERQLQLKQDMRLMGMDEVAGTKQWQRKKSPRVAVLSNMILPGLGQLYNGRRIKVAIVAGLTTFYMGKAWIENKNAVRREIERDKYDPNTREWLFEHSWYEFHKENAKDYLWWSGAIWVIGMLDAYIDAHLFDIRGYTPSADRGEGGKYLTLSFGW